MELNRVAAVLLVMALGLSIGVPSLATAGECAYVTTSTSTREDPTCTEVSVGDIYECKNSDGDKVLFEVIDTAAGTNYEVWVLQESAGADLRVGFNNQVVQTTKATSIEVHTNYYDESRGDWFGETYEDDTEIDSTGVCGMGPYDTRGTLSDPADVYVTVTFSGMTVEVTESETETVTHSEWSEETTTWGISATAEDDGGEITGSYEDSETYGESTTTEWTASSSVTWTSSKHTFTQDYQVP